MSGLCVLIFGVSFLVLQRATWLQGLLLVFLADIHQEGQGEGQWQGEGEEQYQEQEVERKHNVVDRLLCCR